jgi:taurine---2-oxoglutarate transaminase
MARRSFSSQACQSWPRKLPSSPSSSSSTQKKKKTPPLSFSAKHDLPSWNSDQIQQAVEESVMLTWMPGSARHSLPLIRKGKGVYLYDDNDKQYLDWTSQAVCSNLGYSVPDTVLQATMNQLQQLPFCYGGLAMTEIRARFSSLMAELLPGDDLQGMVFPSSGSEANEAAIMAARRFTGKFKVINWYRSYHGGTTNSLAATGDSRRWNNDTIPGFVKAFPPYPLFWDYAGGNEEERTQMALNMLEELILNEGPSSVALIQLESVIGSGGVIIPPNGYMQGVRALCDKYNILMHCDEVMVGFGRTGQLFAFEQFEGVVPDIVTAAKGISSSFLPLSMMACRKHIMEAFEDKPLGWGSTYQAHPTSLACAYENVKYLVRENVIGHVQELAPVMDKSLQQLKEKHPSIKQYRSIGLFGCLDTHLPSGENPQLQHEALDQAFIKYRKAYAEYGLIGLHRPPHLHVAPPLIITKEELMDGFERFDKALDVLDDALGF